MNRAIAVLFVLSLVTAPVAGLAAAVQDNGTTTPATGNQTTSSPSQSTGSEWSPPGPYSRDYLTQAGVHDPDSADSIRLLGDPVRGGMGIRYRPAKPFDNEWQWLEQGSLVRTNRIQVKATAFGEATGEYELVIVYWEESSQRVQTSDGVVSRQYAGDQTVQRVTLTLEDGYTEQWVELQSVYDDPKRVSMWLERDGEAVQGARWQYSHETNPLSQAPASPVSSKYDVLEAVFMYALVTGIPGILIGRKIAQHVLSRTIVSTQWGIGVWLGILAVFLILGLSVAWWQLSVIASILPGVIGLLIAGVAFIGYMGMYDNRVERAEFNRKNLEDTTSVTGEDAKTARTEDIKLRNIIRRNGKIYMPATGIRPLIARYWASPAEVDESDLNVVNDTTGDVSKKYEIDPDEDTTLVHQPTHLSFDPDVTRDLSDDAQEKIDKQVERYAEMDSVAASLMTFPLAVKKTLLQINWSYVVVALGGFAATYWLVNAVLGLPTVGVLLGLLPGAIAGTKAKDGTLDFEPAPYHFSDARAILAFERKEYAKAKTFEGLEEQLVDNDMEGIEHALNLADTVREFTREKFDELTAFEDRNGQPANSGTGTGAEVADD